MKRLLLLILSVSLANLLSAQTVENIRVEQDGENLNIHYRIGGSTSEQLYFVTLTCSIDGGPVFEPKSVIGDVGANIRGGKSFNTVVWDVFEDVDEVGSVEFFVKVDLTKDESVREAVKQTVQEVDATRLKGKKKFDRNVFVAYSGSLGGYWDDYNFLWWDKYRLLGFRAGYLGNWGGYAAVRYGWDYEWDQGGGSIVGGVTKHIMGTKDYRLHGYLGVGAGDLFDEVNAEIGLIGVLLNRITIDVGLEAPAYYVGYTFGIGMIF